MNSPGRMLTRLLPGSVLPPGAISVPGPTAAGVTGSAGGPVAMPSFGNNPQQLLTVGPSPRSNSKGRGPPGPVSPPVLIDAVESICSFINLPNANIDDEYTAGLGGTAARTLWSQSTFYSPAM